MNTGKLPQQMTAITPFLTVKDIDAAVNFYETAFGFTRKMLMPGPDGKTVHAELMHGGCTMMMGCESETCGTMAPTSGQKQSFSLYLYVEDVDRFFKHAVAQGATSTHEPTDMFWGDRVCSVADPFGHHWSFGTFVRELTPDQVMEGMKTAMKEKAHA